MLIEPRPVKPLPLLGFALLLAAGLAGIWLAAGFILPTIQFLLAEYPTQIPAFFSFAFHLQAAAFRTVYPLAALGVMLLGITLVRCGPTRLISISGTIFPWLAGLVAGFSIYLLSCTAINYRLAGGAHERVHLAYRRNLELLLSLEAAQGRWEVVRKELNFLRVIEVSDVSEFNDAEARTRAVQLNLALSKTEDPAVKRRLLATLSLYRKRIAGQFSPYREIPRLAAEVGAPVTKSATETLNWIGENLQQDGWDPIPLFKLQVPSLDI